VTGGYLRIAGGGVRLLPAPPFAVRARGDHLELVGEVDGDERRADVRAGAAVDAALGTVASGPTGPWRVEVGGVYTADWPVDLAIVSAPEPDQPPFFLFSDLAGGLVYVQGPMPVAELPARDGMIGAGQREVGRGDEPAPWIELAYQHRGVGWRQRHFAVPFASGVGCVVTTQAPAGGADAVHRAAATVVRTLAPYSGD
jgi:hypothetical protein